MKTTMLSMFGCAVLMVINCALFPGCRSEEPLAKGKTFFEAASKRNYSLEDQEQLNALITVLAKEPTALEIVEDAHVIDLTDSRGKFKAISVQYQAGGRNVKMIIPIVEKSEGNALYTLSEENCNMKCIALAPCTECNLEVIERCKTLTGSFSGDNGNCSTAVAFNDTVIKDAIFRAQTR